MFCQFIKAEIPSDDVNKFHVSLRQSYPFFFTRIASINYNALNLLRKNHRGNLRNSHRFNDSNWFSVDNRVESIHRIRRVLDDPSGAISFDETVTTTDYIAISRLLLSFRVACQTILDVVGISVLRMRIVVKCWCDFN